MKTNKVVIAFSIFVLICLSGCKTRQSAQKGLYKKDITACEILNKSFDAQPSFETMNISKMSMTINYGQYEFTFKSSIRIATDSLISISIQPALGIEMFRIEMTPECFTVYDKFNRRYAENNYDYIKLRWGFEVNYKSFEALFSHRLFTPTATDCSEFCNNFKISNLADTTSIVGKNPIKGMVQAFDISLIDNRITLTGLQKEGKDVITITYGNLVDFNGIRFPELVYLNASIFEPTITSKLDINKVTFNKPLTISRINTNRYNKIGLSDLLRLK